MLHFDDYPAYSTSPRLIITHHPLAVATLSKFQTTHYHIKQEESFNCLCRLRTAILKPQNFTLGLFFGI